MGENKQPLLSTGGEAEDQQQNNQQDHRQGTILPPTNSSSLTSSFTPDAADIPPIGGVRDLYREFCHESKKLWYLAGPAIFTSLCQYSLGAVTQVFAGQVGTLALAAVSVENSVVAGFSFGVMVVNSAPRTGDSVRASVWGGSARHAGGLYAEIVGDSQHHRCVVVLSLHICAAAAEADRADTGDIGGGGCVLDLDDPAAVRVRADLPDGQVPAGAEQDDGHVGDSGGGSGAARLLQLAADDEAGVGPGRSRRGAQRVVVVHCGGSAGLHLQWGLWASLVWLFMAGVS
ncbi:hypothetical protein TIFTF001_010749 [Ficus carica]|uniref:Protein DETOXIFICATION n=1 Tax=Ficus carica TaxID=3494 RepID=A0AA88D3N3_FICCA|nr:hypothetical protein TIFTF001_010749 [Ficus carica]